MSLEVVRIRVRDRTFSVYILFPSSSIVYIKCMAKNLSCRKDDAEKVADSKIYLPGKYLYKYNGP